MMDVRKVKNRVIFTLSLVILIMVTGILVLAHNNDYGKKPQQPALWNVSFTSIAEGEKQGLATSRYTPYYIGTYASFYVDFVVPGDSIVYDVQVSNRGNLDAKLKDIIYVTSPNKEAIKYEVLDIKEGDILEAGTSKNFRIKASYQLDSNIAVTFNKPISITLNYVQHIK